MALNLLWMEVKILWWRRKLRKVLSSAGLSSDAVARIDRIYSERTRDLLSPRKILSGLLSRSRGSGHRS